MRSKCLWCRARAIAQDRNKVIGVLCIHAHGIARELPAGSEIEVTLTVDEFSRTEARAYVPLLEQWFDEIVRFEAEERSAEQVNQGLNEQQERLKLLEQQAAELEAAQAAPRSMSGSVKWSLSSLRGIATRSSWPTRWSG